MTTSRRGTPKHASVRHAAIVATGYLGWSRLKTLLGKLSVTDPVESVRRDAALMLEVLG